MMVSMSMTVRSMLASRPVNMRLIDFTNHECPAAHGIPSFRRGQYLADLLSAALARSGAKHASLLYRRLTLPGQKLSHRPCLFTQTAATAPAHESVTAEVAHFERRHLTANLEDLGEEENDRPCQLEGGPEGYGEKERCVVGSSAEGWEHIAWFQIGGWSGFECRCILSVVYVPRKRYCLM